MKPTEYIINMIADYYIINKSTVRKTAKFFNISKSSVHNYIHKLLPKYNYPKYLKVQKIADTNFNEKHIRGGLATKLKFSHKKFSYACNNTSQ